MAPNLIFFLNYKTSKEFAGSNSAIISSRCFTFSYHIFYLIPLLLVFLIYSSHSPKTPFNHPSSQPCYLFIISISISISSSSLNDKIFSMIAPVGFVATSSGLVVRFIEFTCHEMKDKFTCRTNSFSIKDHKI
jgi:hypothetical protein